MPDTDIRIETIDISFPAVTHTIDLTPPVDTKTGLQTPVGGLSCRVVTGQSQGRPYTDITLTSRGKALVTRSLGFLPESLPSRDVISFQRNGVEIANLMIRDLQPALAPYPHIFGEYIKVVAGTEGMPPRFDKFLEAFASPELHDIKTNGISADDLKIYVRNKLILDLIQSLPGDTLITIKMGSGEFHGVTQPQSKKTVTAIPVFELLADHKKTNPQLLPYLQEAALSESPPTFAEFMKKKESKKIDPCVGPDPDHNFIEVPVGIPQQPPRNFKKAFEL